MARGAGPMIDMTSGATKSPAADEMIRSFIERICRLHEEKDAIQADIKDIYAEAHGNGIDKTALGVVITRVRKRAKDAAKFDELESLVELYMAAAGPSHTYAREGR